MSQRPVTWSAVTKLSSWSWFWWLVCGIGQCRLSGFVPEQFPVGSHLHKQLLSALLHSQDGSLQTILQAPVLAGSLFSSSEKRH